jgi:hypothetical protein
MAFGLAFAVSIAIAFNFLFPGLGIMMLLTVLAFIFALLLGFFLHDEYVYIQDLLGSLKRFTVGTIISISFALPYRLSWETILLGVLIFLLVNILSIPLFTYTAWLNVDDAQERLISLIHSDSTAYRMGGDEFGGSIYASRTGKLVICSECLSLVGDEDTSCWRCHRVMTSNNRIQIDLERRQRR